MVEGGGAGHGHAATLRDYLHVVRRQKWIILLAVVLVPSAAVGFSLHQEKLYQASAQVLLSSQNLADQLTGTQSGSAATPPDRVAQTQADVARVPQLAQQALAAVPGSGLTPQGLLGASSVTPETNADLLDFSVTNHDPELARRLVDAYANAYEFTFGRAGTFHYHDALHPTLTGTLTINGPPPSLTLALNQPIVTYGTPVTLSGKATSIRLGSTVTIFAQPYGQPSPVQIAVVQAASDGSFAFVTTPQLYTTYTASFQTAPAGVTVQSNSVVAQVAPKVVLRAGSRGWLWTQVLAGKSLAGRHVYLQRLSALGQWVNLAALTLDRDSGRLFRAAAFLPRGRSRIRVSLSVNQAGNGLLGTHSGTQVVTRH